MASNVLRGIPAPLTDEPAVGALVAESWERCESAGLRREDPLRSVMLHASELREKREQNNALIQLAQTELQELFSQVAGANYVVAFADNTGTILEAIHDQEFSSSSASRMVIPGSIWQEDIRGTNALGLSLATRRASVVDGREHYLNRLEQISCFACPVRNSRNEIVGVIDASTDARSRQRHTLALVKLAAVNVENRLFFAEHAGALVLGFHPRQEYLNTTSAALLALNEDGFVIGANGSAQEMLQGSDLSRPIAFENLFDARFSTLLQEVLTRGTAMVKDHMRSTVYFTIKEIGHLMRYINKIHFSSPESRLFGTAAKAPPLKKARSRASTDARDPQILNQLDRLETSLAGGGALLCTGPLGSGKSVVAQQLFTRIAPTSPVLELDCALIGEETYETVLFGNCGRLGYFEPDYMSPITADPRGEARTEMSRVFSGKIQKSAKGLLYLRNVEKMPEAMAEDLLRVISALEAPDPDTYKFHLLLPHVLALGTTKPREALIEEAAPALRELIAEIADELTVPHLNERMDMDYVIRSVATSLDEEKILTVETVRMLSQKYWPSSIRSMRKTLRQVLRASTDQYVRPQQVEPFLGNEAGDVQPCPTCVESVIKRDKCMTIRRTWQQAEGNVSLVSRKLGLSRTTIYAHIPTSD